MKLRTTINLEPEKNQIDYDSRVLLMGSCFVENIGERLNYFKFDHLQNPFGVIFNPVSIEKLVRRAIGRRYFTQEEIFSKEGLWFSFEVHSLVNAASAQGYLQLLNGRLDELRESIISASHCIFTFGTAWAYIHKESSQIVANCHKIPQKEFSKHLLSVDEVSKAIQALVTLIGEVNPKTEVILTVSPVRHLKDGFVENTRSKAHLITGLHQVENTHYFPSYEIVMDELRDYRFYAEDMLHPNEIAVNIIWEHFASVWLNTETDAIRKQVDSIQKALNHRPLNPESAAHETFQENIKNKIAQLVSTYPFLKF